MSATVIISIVAVISFSIISITVAVLVSRTLAKTYLLLSHMQSRAYQQQDKLLDRLAAIKWEDLAALRSIEDSQPGGFVAPEEQQQEGGQEMPTRANWPALSQLQERLSKEEAELLSEDFTAEGDVVR